MEIYEKRYRKGYKPTSSKKPYSKSSCMKEAYSRLGLVLFESVLSEKRLNLRAIMASGQKRMGAGHALKSSNRPTRANIVNVGMQHSDKRNIPPIEARGRAEIPSHQLSRNQIGGAFHSGGNFDRSETFTDQGFTPASTSGSKPLNTAQKGALRKKLVGAYRERHFGSSPTDQIKTLKTL